MGWKFGFFHPNFTTPSMNVVNPIAVIFLKYKKG
jgi:hypothetical protein